MKRVLLIICSILLFVACSKKELDVEVEKTGSFDVAASYIVPQIGVTITGEEYTEYSWETGDIISIFSSGGIGKDSPAVVVAQSDGHTNVKFKGNFDFVADVDNYFALYPAQEDFKSYTFTKDYSVQDGSDKKAALLTACALNASKDNIHFSFKPSNAILRVELTGNDKPSKLNSVRLRHLDGSEVVTGFTFDIISQICQSNFTKSSEIMITNPDPNGFFIALVPDVEMKEFVLIFESDKGIFAKKFNAKTFKKGYTYTASVEWEMPIVTCGARSSYDYYLNDSNADRANYITSTAVVIGELWMKEDGTKSDAHSTYSNIQDEMILEAGININGKDYKLDFKDGIIGYNQRIGIGFDDLRWGKYQAKAYIKTKYNGRIESPDKTIHITGIPYKTTHSSGYFGFYDSIDEGNRKFYPWENISNKEALDDSPVSISWDGEDGVWMEGLFRDPQIASPEFYIPEGESINIYAHSSVDHSGLIDVTLSMHLGSGWNKVQKIASKNLSNGNSTDLDSPEDMTLTFTENNNRIIFHHEYGATGPRTEVEFLKVKYKK